MFYLLLALFQAVMCVDVVSQNQPADDLSSQNEDIVALRMPEVTIPHNDTYYHLQHELTELVYITGYKPQANSSTVHHMLLYGCRSVKTRATKVWIGGSPCEEEPKILWSWALDAAQFDMPDNVTMEVGNDDIQFLVMELHYKLAQPEEYRDSSGVDVLFTKTKTRYQAGIYLFMAVHGSFPPHEPNIQMDLACNYTSPEIHVFAFRTHAHNYATMISGYLEHNESWSLIGQRDPRLPEMFVSTYTILDVHPGDTLYARCEYNTTAVNTTIVIGNTHRDEMCNLYLMYYVDSAEEDVVRGTCTNQEKFYVPNIMNSFAWWELYIQSRMVWIMLIALIASLVFCPIGYCVRIYWCPSNSYYKRPNDGFEKLFTPDDDDEEDEILYKSYKHSY